MQGLRAPLYRLPLAPRRRRVGRAAQKDGNLCRVRAPQKRVPNVRPRPRPRPPRRQAIKLHTQYGHCSAARLNALLRTAGTTDDEVFDAVTAAAAACDACKKTAPRPARPLVTVPRALKFTETVAVDLAQVSPVGTFLHMVDLGTWFSKAVALDNKEAPTVARALLGGWILHHGAPCGLLADPGAKFNDALWRIVAERHNIVILSTAAQALWSKGIVERHNLTLK